MDNHVLDEQLAYYRARAQEYDESILQIGRFASGEARDEGLDSEWEEALAALYRLGPLDHVLELACGTGIWTQALRSIGKSITALDGSPEMLAQNRSKLADPRVHYQCVNLFEWEPGGEQFDLVFFAFWLSHVPPQLLAPFLAKAGRAVRPGGHIFMVDEPAGGQQVSGPVEDGQYQHRTLADGRAFTIVKVYYDPQAIQTMLECGGFGSFSTMPGQRFFYLSGVKV